MTERNIPPAARTATILNLQRMSTEDGPGIRTTVFFKGCSLSCQWCHNPESISHERQIVWNPLYCLHCGTCVALCPEDAIRMSPDRVTVDPGRCRLCEMCTQQCPTLAMECLGKAMTVSELMDELLKDRAYFERSGGGVTLSGGEPALQAGFAEEVLERCLEEGIHTALDTCGLVGWPALERLLERTDLLLYDLKLMKTDLHRRFTGEGNEVILDNLGRVARFIQASPRALKLWIRTPIIPGITATRENMVEIGRFLSSHLAGLVERWELLAFNNLCQAKYRRLGRIWPLDSTPLMTQDELDELRTVASMSVAEPSLVVATGLSRLKVENGQRGVDRGTARGEV